MYKSTEQAYNLTEVIYMKKTYLKNINIVLFSGFILAIIFSFMGFNASCEALSDKLIRLHVVANSDSDDDQEIKITVKDEINEYTETLMASAENLESANDILVCELESIEKIANETLVNLGVNYKAEVTLTEEYFGTRVYDNFTLPAGYYSSLMINLGEANGQNWWCVVYPMLCTGTALEEAETLDKSEVELIEDTPKIIFWIYEWYMNMKNLWTI